MTDTRPVALDFFCCQGGLSAGLAAAGFRVIGSDIDPQPNYPFEFVQADAIADFAAVMAEVDPDVVGGSPPCQGYSAAQVIQGREHPKLIAPFRELLATSELPWWIENVEGARAELDDPVLLCGLMFGLKTDRHRLFETDGFTLAAPQHPTPGSQAREDHRDMPKTKMGRPFVDGELRQYVGNFHGPAAAREDLGVPWMSRDGIRECVPPAYGELLGAQMLAHLGVECAA
jgi:DNA (cytosine-5)-methyltransferase 1